MMTRPEVAALMGIHNVTLHKFMHAGKPHPPPFAYYGERRTPLWEPSQVRAWLARREQS